MEYLLKKIYSLYNDIVNLIIRSFLQFEYVRRKSLSENVIILFSSGGIGDYILKTPVFEGYRNLYGGKVALICRSSIASLAEKNPYIDYFIFINLDKYKFSFPYRVTFYSQLFKIKAKTFINLDYSTHQEILAMHIIKTIKFKTTIAQKCLDVDTIRNHSYYNVIVDNQKEWLFEVRRNIDMLQQLGGIVKTSKTKIWGVPEKSELLDNLIGSNNFFFILAIGSLMKEKMYPAEKFAYIVDNLLKNSLFCIIVGTSEEYSYAEEIVKEVSYNSKIINMVGKTNLIDLSYYVSKSAFVLSNDSSTAHIAVALNKRVFVILGGGHFGRFFPYPNGTDKVIINEPYKECFNCYWVCKYKDFRCISNIDAELVLKKILEEI